MLFLSTVETDSPQSVKEDRGLVVTTYLELPKILNGGLTATPEVLS